MKKTNIVLNFLYNSVYQILLILLPLITTPYISRVLGAEGVGVFSYTYSIAYCCAIIGMLGVNNYGNRTIATYQRNRELRSKSFWSIFTIQIIMSIAVLLIYIIYVVCFCTDEYKVVFYVQIVTVMTSLFDINWFFFGMEKFKLSVSRNIIIRVLTVICMFVFVKGTNGVVIYTFLAVGGQLISNIVMWPFLKRYVDYTMPALKDIKIHIKPMLILFIPVIAVTLYNRMDKVMIGAFSNILQSGFYESSEKIISIPLGLITSLGTVMLPRMSSIFSNGDIKTAKKYIRISMDFICFMSIALIFGLSAISAKFVPLFFGPEFNIVTYLIILISPTIFFKAWANVIRTQYLIPLHKDKSYVVSIWLGAVVNLIINFILISKYGAVGAVIGTVCAEGIVMIYQTWSVRKLLPTIQYIKHGMIYVIPGIIMFIVIRIIGNNLETNAISIIIEIIVGGIVYIILCLPFIIKRYSKPIRILIKK